MISIENGIAQWDWQMSRFWARVGGVEFFAPTMEEFEALVFLTPQEKNDLLEMKG